MKKKGTMLLGLAVVVVLVGTVMSLSGTKGNKVKEKKPVENIENIKVDKTIENGNGALTLKNVEVEKVNKVNDNTITDAENNLESLKTPYYRVTYNVILKNNATYKADLSLGSWTLTLDNEAHAESNLDDFYADVHSGILNQGASIKGEFVLLMQDKMNVLPATFDSEGLAAVYKEGEDISSLSGGPMTFTFDNQKNKQ
ncbi:hypothetical protein [Weissella confusa]